MQQDCGQDMTEQGPEGTKHIDFAILQTHSVNHVFIQVGRPFKIVFSPFTLCHTFDLPSFPTHSWAGLQRLFILQCYRFRDLAEQLNVQKIKHKKLETSGARNLFDHEFVDVLISQNIV